MSRAACESAGARRTASDQVLGRIMVGEPKLASVRHRTLLTSLIASAILAATPGYSIEPTREMSTEDEKKAAAGDDYQILELVLLDLIEFKDFSPSIDVGTKSDIVLSEKTAGSSGLLSDGQLGIEFDGKRTDLIPAAIREGLRSRNPNEPVSLRGFKSSSPKILVRDLSALERFRKSERNSEFKRTYPNARGYVKAWLPGYSTDGQTAVPRALLGPTPHTATATYMLTKKNGRWTVVWRKVARYL